MGVIFIVLTAACFALASALISLESIAVYALTCLTSALAIAGYAATRLVAFPELADDLGNWAEPLGLVSIATEGVALIVSASVLRAQRALPVAVAG